MNRRLVLFLGAVAVGAAGSGGFFWAIAEPPGGGPSVERPLTGQWLSDRIFVREQMTPADVAGAGTMGFATIVDLRPDGEAPGQPAYAEMAEAVVKTPMSIHYVPVPHGPIPDAAVEKLGAVLRTTNGPVLLYCRSGSRAARTWALAEASRAGGADAETIFRVVRTAGFQIDDLKDQIASRLATRGQTAN